MASLRTVSIAAIVLAAGGSTRMGTAKQVLVHRGKSLVRAAAEAALAAGCCPVAVVVGAGADLVIAEVAGLAVQAVENPAWDRGMGTSIRAGMMALRNVRGLWEFDAVVITLADQPLVDAAALGGLIQAFVAGKCAMAAAGYGGLVGVPAVFGRELFAELAALPDGAGAKGLLQRGGVTTVPMEGAAMDVDTPEDFARLLGERQD